MADERILSDITRERILLEEQYRRKVSNELDSEKQSTSVWKILNQPFTIFFLSSIVLAAVASWYQAQEQRAKYNERIARLNYEIGHRAVLMKRSLRILDSLNGQTVLQLDEVQLKELTNQLNQVLQETDKYYLFPEYASWSTSAVVRAAIIENELNHIDKENYRRLIAYMGALEFLRDVRADLVRINASFDEKLARNLVVTALTANAALEVYAADTEVRIKESQDNPNMLNIEVIKPRK